jgi:hypothetical protein
MSDKTAQILRVRRANFSKPGKRSSKTHTLPVNASTAASGGNDSERCDECT